MLWSVTEGANRRQVLSGAGAMASSKARSSVSSKFEAQMLAVKLRPATAAASATAASRLPAVWATIKSALKLTEELTTPAAASSNTGSAKLVRGGAFTQFFVETCLAKQDLLHAIPNGCRTQGLATHCLMGI
jgi:hypothetical protein